MQFIISNVINTLNKHGMFSRYLILDHAVIRKVLAAQDIIESRGYKDVYLSPYSLFVNPIIKLFWSKVKAGVKREDLFTATDNLSARVIESVERV